jgi:type IV fimbrial biogenesis protein FimT
MKTQMAFTLIELIATLAVAAILVSVALPNMRYMLLSNRITSKTNEFIAAINYIRTESITRSNIVQIKQVDNTNTNNEWGKGWEIRVDLDNDGNVNDDNDIVKIFEFPDDQIVIDQIVPDATYADTPIISYRARGRIQKPYKFLVCNNEHPEGREVTITRVGRASAERCSLNNGENPCDSSCN